MVSSDLRLGKSPSLASDRPIVDANAVNLETWPTIIRGYVAAEEDPAETLYECAATGRTAWKLLLDLHAETTVLNIGCGTGLVASAIAPIVSQVVAVDFRNPPLLIARERFALFNPDDNITTIRATTGDRLPFADAVFDCVVLCKTGWGPRVTGEARWNARRRELVAIKGFLKQNGQVFWVTENSLQNRRWWRALQHLVGRRPDDAPNQRSASTELTYFGCRRILKKAGYSKPQMFSLPGTASFIGPVAPLTMVPKFWKPPPTNTYRSRLRTHRFVVSRFGILAGASPNHPSSGITEILQHIEERLAPGETRRFLLRHFGVSRKGKVVLIVEFGEREIVVRVPLTQPAIDSDERNADMLSFLSSVESGSINRSQVTPARVVRKATILRGNSGSRTTPSLSPPRARIRRDASSRRRRRR